MQVLQGLSQIGKRAVKLTSPSQASYILPLPQILPNLLGCHLPSLAALPYLAHRGKSNPFTGLDAAIERQSAARFLVCLVPQMETLLPALVEQSQSFEGNQFWVTDPH